MFCLYSVYCFCHCAPRLDTEWCNECFDGTEDQESTRLSIMVSTSTHLLFLIGDLHRCEHTPREWDHFRHAAATVLNTTVSGARREYADLLDYNRYSEGANCATYGDSFGNSNFEARQRARHAARVMEALRTTLVVAESTL